MKKSNLKQRLYILEHREDDWWLEIIGDEIYAVNDPKKATVCTYTEALNLKMELQESALYGIVYRYLRVPKYEELVVEQQISEGNIFFRKKKPPVVKELLQPNPFFKPRKKRKKPFNDTLGLFKNK
jgi:hypothetical protein